MSDEEEEHYKNCHTLFCDYVAQEQLSGSMVVSILASIFSYACQCASLPKKDMKMFCDKIADKYIPLFHTEETQDE